MKTAMATQAQILKLLLMLEDAGQISRENYDDDIRESEAEGAAWVRDKLDLTIDDLSDLSMDEIQRCFKELE